MSGKNIVSARTLAFQVLQDVFGEGAYANIALSKRLNEAKLSPVDRRFATELVYGTIKASGTLDWMLGHYLKRPLSQTDPLVVNIMRIGMYQLQFLDKIPASAAVNEAVNLAKKFAHPGASGFVNAVLRSVIREPDRIRYPNFVKDPVRSIALRECHPEWLVKRWLDQIGPEETLELCRFNNTQPPLSLRTNTLKISRAELLQKLLDSGTEAEISPLAPEGIICHRLGDEPLQLIRQGLCQAQDESSMLVAHIVDPKPGELVIVNRSPERADALADALGEPERAHSRYWQDMRDLGDFELIVNATSAGRGDGNGFSAPLSLVNSRTLAVDVNYGEAAIDFLAWARAAGCHDVVDGLGMLVEQAAEAFEHWHGVRPQTDAVYAALRERDPVLVTAD